MTIGQSVLVDIIPFEYKIITESETGSEITYLEGICQRTDSVNQNGRLYPHSIMKKKVDDYINRKVSKRNAYGRMDHPPPNDPMVGQVLFEGASHLVVDLWWKDKDLYCKLALMDNHWGNTIKSAIKVGGSIGISSRGAGSLLSKSGHKEIGEDFEIVAFDLVTDPSTINAWVKPSVLTESKLRNINKIHNICIDIFRIYDKINKNEKQSYNRTIGQ